MAASLPISVLSDSYKASHHLQYPDANRMSAYGEFRTGFEGDAADSRIVVYGIRYVVENYLLRQWTMEDVERADAFFKCHLAPMYTEYPWPKELFEKIVKENDGYFPVTVQALAEGSCVHAHVPIFQVTAEGEWSKLCTYLETLLTHVWYPCTVATLSRRVRDAVEEAFEAGVEGGRESVLLESRLHDFGMRGCTCLEQTVIGGTAHLLNFTGSDTMSACYYAQFELNGGRPIGNSIPATEHSVMMSWPSESDAISNMIDKFGDGLFACVMDSYNYTDALNNVIPVIAEAKTARGGFMVLRPDSGDPVEAVMQGLHAAEATFGATKNAKGYKVINGAGVIQGDGIDITVVRKILAAVLEAGFSPENVAFGMGAGLLQKVNRDSMSFATKLSFIEYADGRRVDVMKHPQTDSGKLSMPGRLAVKAVDGVPTVFPEEDVAPEENLLRVVYERGPVECEWPSFDAIRGRVKSEWGSLPPGADPLSGTIKAKIDASLAAAGKATRFS